MTRIATACGIGFGLFLGTITAADSVPEQPKSKEIPLGRIWAYKMPGTRNIRELDPKLDLKRLEADLKDKSANERERALRAELIGQSDVLKIMRILKRNPKPVGPTFVVEGKGQKALQNALKKFSKRDVAGDVAPTALPSHTELSLVWFSQPCGHYIRLVAVERSTKSITVKYRVVVHQKGVMTPYLALIPVGQFTEGAYQVNIEQLPPTDELGRPIEKTPVCPVSGSFSFEVDAT